MTAGLLIAGGLGIMGWLYCLMLVRENREKSEEVKVLKNELEKVWFEEKENTK